MNGLVINTGELPVGLDQKKWKKFLNLVDKLCLWTLVGKRLSVRMIPQYLKPVQLFYMSFPFYAPLEALPNFLHSLKSLAQ
jgi:hypothetical protein